MKTLEKGQDKIQKICDKIRRETLEPAKEEAESIIVAAKKKAEEIVKEAEHHAEQLIKQAKVKIEQERTIFHSSLQQAAKQMLESLRQQIEVSFFNEELQSVLAKNLSHPQLIADLINSLVKAVEKEGIRTDFSAVIPRSVSPDDVTDLLLDSIKKRLQAAPLEIGHFAGGAQVKLVGRKMTLDLTDQALKELLANYVRKDFRQIVFGS
jgi:V/A-type H+-transporting ATPase subunit E